MIKVILPLLLLCGCYLPVSAQNCPGKEVPYKAQISGQTDSITVEALLQAGKIECTNKAFEIVSFTLGVGGNCLVDGFYSEASCPSASFSDQALSLIRRLRSGSRFFLDCVRVKNKVGEVYVLRSSTMRIRSKSPDQLITK